MLYSVRTAYFTFQVTSGGTELQTIRQSSAGLTSLAIACYISSVVVTIISQRAL